MDTYFTEKAISTNYYNIKKQYSIKYKYFP